MSILVLVWPKLLGFGFGFAETEKVVSLDHYRWRLYCSADDYPLYKLCRIHESGTSGISYSIPACIFSSSSIFCPALSSLFCFSQNFFVFLLRHLAPDTITQLYETTEDVLLFCTKGSATCVLITLLTYYSL